MNLNSYKNEVQIFLNSLKSDNWNIDKKISELGKEYRKLKLGINDKKVSAHQIYDMLFILFEIAHDLDVDIEKEWQEGKIRKQQKYIK